MPADPLESTAFTNVRSTWIYRVPLNHPDAEELYYNNAEYLRQRLF